MKRTIFGFFVLAAIAVMMYPGLHPQAQNSNDTRPTRLSRRQQILAQRRMQNPHAGMTSHSDRVGEVAQVTREVSATLPQLSKIQPVVKSKSRITPLPSADSDNPIDVEIFSTLAAQGVEPAQPATDEEFCRRVTLDITGRQPTPERLLQYLADSDPQKKEKLINELLESDAYVDYWTQWFGDLTRNYATTDEARERNAQYTYLRKAVAENKSIRQVATDLITYNGQTFNGPGGFLVRPILGTDIAQDAFDEITAETVSTFLGTQAICISCHNGQGHLEPINLYFAGKKRSDFWGISAFFAQTSFKYDSETQDINIFPNRQGTYLAESSEGMRPPRSGGVIEPSYELFGKTELKSNEDRRVALARLITSDPQFARAFANRIFARFFVIGLVDPVDGFDLARLDPDNPPPSPWQLQPSHPVLLQKLAKYFSDNNFDLKGLISLVARSKAYALSSRYDETQWKVEYTRLYARKLVRRLDAEEVLDSLTASTLQPGSYTATGFNKPFASTMALPGVEEPNDIRNGPRQSDNSYLVQSFLQTFGRGDRNTNPRTNRGSITQALALFNSPLLIRRVESSNGLAKLLAQQASSSEEAIIKLYLYTLSRRPTEDELSKIKPHLADKSLTLNNLQWALFNRAEFLYNY